MDAPAPGVGRVSEIVSVELLLDSASEGAVRAEWDALAAAGLSSLAAHNAPSNRPHITLLARTSEVDDSVAAVAQSLPIAVTLGAPVLFGVGDRRVLARSVVPSVELLRLHAATHAAAGSGEDVAHTLPGSWTPHVTLARRVALSRLPQALALVQGDIMGAAEAMRVWDAASRTVTPLG